MSNKLEVRSSQALYNYSTGSIADFPDLSLMILSPDITSYAWGDEDHKIPPKQIKDDRLADIFSIEEFRQPPEPNKKTGFGIQAIRFPQTLFCPVCRKIYYVKNLRDRDDLFLDRKGRHYDKLNQGYFCSSCYENNGQRISLSPTRFIIANEYGFIDDFPWDWYCHRNEDFQEYRRYTSSHNTSCYDQTQGEHLKLLQLGGSASLSDMKVKCTVCNTSESLGAIFDQEETFMRPYDNYLVYRRLEMPQPWLGRQQKDKSVIKNSDFTENEIKSITDDNKENLKRVFPRTLQRGAGNVHFPITHKGISLPLNSYQSKDDQLLNQLDNWLQDIFEKLATFSELESEKEKVSKLLDKGFEEYIDGKLIEKIGRKNVELHLRNKINPSDKELVDTEKVRWQEYNCFLDFDDSEAKPSEWYKSKVISGNNYTGLNFVNKVVILNKLRLLNILKGFTRVRPLALNELKFARNIEEVKNNLEEEFQRINDVRKFPESTKWLPANEIKGEGIFISLNKILLNEWVENVSEVSKRSASLRNNYTSNLKKFDPHALEEDHDYINATYILLHTLSHLLIDEIAQTSGYNAASLSEIIYSSRENSDYEMAGILIYTSSSDAEGTLGGLAEHGKSGKLEELFNRALTKAKWCSSDPLCIETESGQGFMGVNLSACHSCCMLPESSCENLNKFLDRALLVGTLENNELGFFNYIKAPFINE